jgi:hypothetical protein
VGQVFPSPSTIKLRNLKPHQALPCFSVGFLLRCADYIVEDR